jgi:hypothetical protein
MVVPGIDLTKDIGTGPNPIMVPGPILLRQKFPVLFLICHPTIAGFRQDTGIYPMDSLRKIGENGNGTSIGTMINSGKRVGADGMITKVTIDVTTGLTIDVTTIVEGPRDMATKDLDRVILDLVEDLAEDMAGDNLQESEIARGVHNIWLKHNQ